MECPWSNPDFDLSAHISCPICGVLGYDPEEIEAKCVDCRGRMLQMTLFLIQETVKGVTIFGSLTIVWATLSILFGG